MSEIPSAEQIQREEAAEYAVRREVLEKVWSREPGFYGWLTDTNHKGVAEKYIVTAFRFLRACRSRGVGHTATTRETQ